MTSLSSFDYTLPPELIAQTPTVPRDSSRLLMVDRTTGNLQHKHFRDLPDLLTNRDVLVLNNSKTLPMRTHGIKESGGKIEVLFIKKLEQHESHELWEVLSQPGLKTGQVVRFDGSPMTITCTENPLGYTRVVGARGFPHTVVAELHKIGELPTPHYIKQHLEDQHQYQTIYAKPEGSAATPTAGLHFTSELLATIRAKNIPIVELTLHVGLGTFLPVKTEDIEQHQMHAEWFTLTKETADQLNQFKKENRRIIAVGTTTTRVLESCATNGILHPKTGETALYIYPPYRFQFVDALITNFHLPKSTLLMLVSAFGSQDKQFTTFSDSLVGKAYAEAIAKGYRFYSFGDAMMIM